MRKKLKKADVPVFFEEKILFYEDFTSENKKSVEKCVIWSNLLKKTQIALTCFFIWFLMIKINASVKNTSSNYCMIFAKLLLWTYCIYDGKSCVRLCVCVCVWVGVRNKNSNYYHCYYKSNNANANCYESYSNIPSGTSLGPIPVQIRIFSVFFFPCWHLGVTVLYLLYFFSFFFANHIKLQMLFSSAIRNYWTFIFIQNYLLSESLLFRTPGA